MDRAINPHLPKDISPRKDISSRREKGDLGGLTRSQLRAGEDVAVSIFQGPNPNSHFRRSWETRVPPTPGPIREAGPPQRPRGRRRGRGQCCPSPLAWNTPVRRRELSAPQSPTQAERGKGQYGRLHPLTLQVGARARVRQGLPRGLKRGRPRGGGAWMGALTSHPSPSGRWRFRNTPPAPVRRVGEAAEQPGALQRHGEERAWARGRHPRAAPRASKAPYAQGRARAPKRRRPCVAEAADSRLVPPTPSPLIPRPLQPAPGLTLLTDLTGRDMFAVETGPSWEAKDQDPPHPARWAPPPTSAEGAAAAEPRAAGFSNSAAPRSRAP